MQTILLSWLGEMLSINEKSHVIYHLMTLQLFGTPKNCAFGKITKR